MKISFHVKEWVMKKLTIILSLFLIAFFATNPVFAGMSGTAATGVQIQNLSSSSSATVVVDLWNQDGSAPTNVLNGVSVNSGSAVNIYMPSQSSVPAGTYAAVVSSSQPMAAIVRTDWSATGGAAIYSNPTPAKDIIVPLVVNNYSRQTSSISIQNTNSAADVTDVTIDFYQNGASSPVKSLSGQVIKKGTSRTYNLSDASLGVPSGFAGLARIKSVSTDLVVATFIDLAGSRAVSAFSGVPAASGASTLYCPLVRANYYGDTGISIVNPNGTAGTATITFYPGTGSGGPYVQTIPVPANSSALAFQGLGGNSRSDTTPALPAGSGQTMANPTPTNNGFYGSATIEMSGGLTVMAMVNDTLFGSSWSVRSQSSYNCLTSSDAGTSVALPLVRGKHLTTLRLSTGIQIQNTTGSSITVSLKLYNPDGTERTTSEPAAVNIGPNGSANIWGGNFANLPAAGWYGSGLLQVTGGSVVALVDDSGFGPVAVDSANYTGFSMAP
jgi:hypothetical protein